MRIWMRREEREESYAAAGEGRGCHSSKGVNFVCLTICRLQSAGHLKQSSSNLTDARRKKEQFSVIFLIFLSWPEQFSLAPLPLMPNKIAHFKLKQIKIFLKTLLVLVCLDESEPLGLVLVRLGNIGISWKVDCHGVRQRQLHPAWF